MVGKQHRPDPEGRLDDAGWFLREAFRTFRATGAVAPSSPFLAQRLTRFVEHREPPDRPLAILEAGAGTGPVSQAIMERMREDDTLDLVESNERFARRLRDRIRETPTMARVADRTTVHQDLVTNLDRSERFDVIVSGLPFANFTAEEVAEIFEYYFTVLRPGGHLSLFGYLATKHVKAVIAPRDGYLRQARARWVFEEWVARYGVGRERVMLNVPPAWIYHLRKPDA